MTTLAEVRERHERLVARAAVSDWPEEYMATEELDRAFLLAEVDRLKALCGRAAEYIDAYHRSNNVCVADPFLLMNLRDTSK